VTLFTSVSRGLTNQISIPLSLLDSVEIGAVTVDENGSTQTNVMSLAQRLEVLACCYRMFWVKKM
jgi:hypothetical protein